MTVIPDELIEQVRDAADMVHVLGDYVDLKRTGADYRGPCPFHGGKDRNFSVVPRKQMFYCFVCHAGGDVFTFFMRQFGMDYPTAVREVAQKVGIVIPERPTGGPDPREPLFGAAAVAQEWYAARLRESPDAEPARRYLADRGLDLDALQPLGLGFAPKGNAFLEAMERLGISTEVLLEAGLAVAREDGSLRPRFWGRLLFPIHDLRGRVVGFGGRVLGDAPEGAPKYLNSPESRIFHKGQLLYNLHNAKPVMRRMGRAVVVEGYFDVLRAVEAGVEHVVAPLGTALTTDQAALLKRYANEVVLLYDSDQAGMRASFRAADELLRAQVRPLIATLPPGEDPDTLVQRGGAEALQQVLDDAIDVFERMLQLIDRRGWLGTLTGRRRALDRVLPTLRAARDPITRDLYVSRASEMLGITAESIRREINAKFRPEFEGGRPPTRRAPGARGGHAERELLRVMLHEPTWRSRIAEHLPATADFTDAERVVFDLLAAAPDDLTGAGILAHLVDPAAQAVVEDLLQLEWGDLDVDAQVAGALGRIDQRPITARLAEIEREMAVAPEERKLDLVREKDALVRERRAKGNSHFWKITTSGRSSAV